MQKVQVDELANEVMRLLTQYSDEISEKCKDVVEEVAKEVSNEIRAHCNFKGTGKYINNFKLTTSYEDSRNKRITWHVKSPHYRLTHLLEFGHITRSGGRTRVFPHVRFGDEYVKTTLPKKIKEAIENCKI